MLRKASLACPKTVAGLFPVAFESPIFRSGHSRFFDVVRNACPKPFEFRAPTFPTRFASFQDGYLIVGWFVGGLRNQISTL